MTSTIDPTAALIYVMVAVSASDADINDREMFAIGDVVHRLPAFDEFPDERLVTVAQDCAAILAEPDGLRTVLGLARDALPGALRETALAFAWEVALVDRVVTAEEARILQIIAEGLGVDPMVAAAIGRGIGARYVPLG